MAYTGVDGNTTLLVDKIGASSHLIGISIGATSATNLPITISDTPIIDAFDRIRVSNPVTLFDSAFHYDKQEAYWWEKVTDSSGSATATYTIHNANVALTAGPSDTVIRQSKQYSRYQPGKSLLVLLTFTMAPSATGLTQQVGYYDDRDGIFLREKEGVPSFVVRTHTTGSAADTEVSQSNWNLDPLDGTGKSGLTLDMTKSQIFVFDAEWLGVGRVRTGFVIDGIVVYAHEFLHANRTFGVYTSTMNLPIRYEISGGSNLSGTHTLNQICSTVMSEGGFEAERGLPSVATNGTSLINVGTTPRPILSIRPKLTFAGDVNRGTTIPDNVTVFSEDQTALFSIYYGASVSGGGVWTSVSDYSIMEYDVGASVIAGGIRIGSDYAPATVQSKSSTEINKILGRLPLSLDIDGNHPGSPLSDCLTIVGQARTSTTDMGAIITWSEFR